MTPQEIEKHIVEVYDKILEITNKMKTSLDTEFNYYFTLSDLLCRIGELESSLKYVVDKKKDENAEPTRNRLCTCYDTGEADYQNQEDYDNIDDYYDDDYDNCCMCDCCNH